MDGWQNQNSGLGGTGWMPLYMMGSQMGSQMGMGQGQPSQTQLGPNGSAPPLGVSPPNQGAPMGLSPLGQMSPVQNTGGPDRTGMMPGGGYAFDGSGSDAGVGGQPINQMQTPWQNAAPNFGQNSMRPPMLADFRQNVGRQIQGNPTSQLVGGGGIGSIGLGSLGGGNQQR